MVLSQEIENLFGLGGLGEGGVAAQIAEHDDDLAAMAFEDFLVALRDDQLRQLRRQKPFQPSDPAQFLDLFGDLRFEVAIERGDLVGTLAQFADEPRIFHRDDRLRRKIFEQRDLLVGERTDLLAVDPDASQEGAVLAQGDRKDGAGAQIVDKKAAARVDLI